MNFYPHHIGDFVKSTANLTHEERSIYLQLIWKYYDTEKPLPDDIESLAIDVGARGKSDLIQYLLKRYFIYDNDMKSYTHNRIESEISKYKAKSDRAKSALASRWSKTDMKSQTKSNTNQEPRTNNHKPSKDIVVSVNTPPSVSVKDKSTLSSNDLIIILPSLPKQVADDFLTVRKAKKLPLTKTALAGIEREGKLAGLNLTQTIAMCASKGWGGFKASWLEDGKTFAEKTQDFKNEQGKKAFSTLASADEETLKKWGLKK